MDQELVKLLSIIKRRVLPQMRQQPEPRWGQTNWPRLADDLQMAVADVEGNRLVFVEEIPATD